MDIVKTKEKSLLNTLGGIKVKTILNSAIGLLGGNPILRKLYFAIGGGLLGYMSANWLCPSYINSTFGFFAIVPIFIGIIISIEEDSSTPFLMLSVPSIAFGIGIMAIDGDIGSSRSNGYINSYSVEELNQKSYKVNLNNHNRHVNIYMTVTPHFAQIENTTNVRNILYQDGKLCISGLQCLSIEKEHGILTEQDGSVFGRIEEVYDSNQNHIHAHQGAINNQADQDLDRLGLLLPSE